MIKHYQGILLSIFSLLLIVVVPFLSGGEINEKQVVEQVGEVIDEAGELKLGEGEYLVTRVIDGDTIELSNGQKVRYIGVDTPETVKPRTAVQCYGIEASEYNRAIVEGKVVTLEKDVNETDRNGRLLRYVYVDSMMVNEILVQEGYAVASAYPPDVKYQDRFDELERVAQENGKGLWGRCGM